MDQENEYIMKATKIRHQAVAAAFLLMALLGHKAHGQSSTELPNIISPSPETVALFRFSEYGVSGSTGVPDISIPLYEVRSGGLSVPISISYNASGRLVSDETGPIGVGWSLNTGGMISKTVYGKDDEQYTMPQPSEFPTAQMLSQMSDYDRYNKLSSFFKQMPDENTPAVYDTEYDVFSYVFAGNSGKFLFRDRGDSDPVLLPGKPYRIEANGSALTNIHITDDKGVLYSFGGGFYETPKSSNGLYTTTTAWYLSQITSADGKDKITFNYKGLEQKYAFKSQEYIITDQVINMTAPYLNGYPTKDTTGEYKLCRITEIAFANGKVSFLLDSATNRVRSIEVRNEAHELVRAIEFRHSLLDFPVEATLQKFKLDQILIKDGNNTIIEEYTFEYYPTKSGINDDTYELANRDWWGYRNGTTQTQLLPDYHNIYYDNGVDQGMKTFGYGANRSPIATYAMRGILKKITFPTGGSTEFVYEGNRYMENGAVKDGPGLRLSHTTTADGHGNTLLKAYKYGMSESGYGTLPYYGFGVNPICSQAIFLNIDMGQDDMQTTIPGKISNGYRKRILSSDYNAEISYLAGQPVMYPQVTEYVGTPTANTGKTIYRYRGGTSSDYLSYPDPLSGGTLATYDNSEFTYDDTMPKHYIRSYNFWNTSVLTSREDYRNTGTVDNTGKPDFAIEHLTSYVYEPVDTDTVRSLSVYQYLEFANLPDEKNAGQQMGIPVYGYADYFITVGIKELTGIFEVNYSDKGKVTKKTSYTYNSRGLVSETRQITSAGEELVTQNLYPFDLQAGAIHQAMEGRNMLNYVVEQKEYRDAVPLQSMRASYRDWGNGVIAPELISTRQGTGAYEPRLRYHAYGAGGRIRSVSKQEGVPITYVWGYNSQYPVAEIRNTTHAEVETALGGAAAVEELASSDTLSQAQQDKLNGLRGLLPNAMVTTYTYDPLIGMTSATDANGLTTYYEYDDLGRLKLLKDDEGNIIKMYTYNYRD